MEIEIKDEKQISTEVDNYKELLKDFKVTDTKSLTFALQVQKDIRSFVKYAKAYFKPDKDKKAEELQKVRDKESSYISPLITGDEMLGNLINNYNLEQRRLEAIKKKELELEEVKKAELEKKDLEDQAKKEKASGNEATADLLTQMAGDVNPAPAIVKTSVPSSIRRDDGQVSNLVVEYDIAIIKEREFIQAVAKGEIPLSCIKVTPMLREFKNWVKQNKICPEGGSVVYKGVEIKECTGTKSR